MAFDPVLAIRTLSYDRSPANVERLASALRALSARLRVARAEPGEELPFLLDAKTLLAGDSFTFVSDAGDLEVLGTPSGTRGFDDLAGGIVVLDADDVEVPVVTLDDLMRMKRASGRPKDLLALQVLEELADVLREQLND